jgi:hypothetical protein
MRYEKTTDTTRYVWGYDKPGREYFLQAYTLDEAGHNDTPLFSVGSRFTEIPHPDFPHLRCYSNADLLTLIKHLGLKQRGIIPFDHIQCILLDLPF